MPPKFDLSPSAPKAYKSPKTIEQLGKHRTDNYAWLKDDNWQNVMLDPSLLAADIREHLETENAYTQAVLSPLETLKTEIFEEMKGRIEAEDKAVPTPDGNYAYSHKYRKGDQHGIYIRSPIENGDIKTAKAEEIILDADALANEHIGFFLT